MSKIQYQEDQAERIYECLFSKGKDRYLLADEVGLGKTVTSARVIYKFAKISKKPIINIGYICGNKALAIQNIKKLRERILECDSEEKTIEIVDKPAENLSLGFLTLGDRPETESKKKIVIHVITPSTTIKTLSEGTVRERAYAYCLITGNKDDKNKDDFLWEACLGKASEETFVKELKKVNICGFEKYNSSLYHFKINFKDRIKIEWQKEKEKCLEKCKDECLKQIFCEGNLSKKNIKNYYEKIREEKQKKDTEERLSDYLKAIEEENQGVFTKEYLKELSGKLSGEKSSDISRKERKTSEDIEEGLSDIIIKYVKEYIKLARKCMAVSSVKAMQMDLFVADEIQNYSELFKTIKEGNTELGLVVQEIIQGNQKLLLMSATPFRYHSKQSDLENENKEKEADDNDDEKSDDSESESSNIKGQDYLEKESDIYQEFQTIVKYLNKDFNFIGWEEYIREKENILASPGAFEEYKVIVDKQSEMLLESNVSRVERFMSGIKSGFKEDNMIADLDDIYFKEILSFPQNDLEVYRGDETVDYKIFYNGEWYCKKDNKYWRYDNADDDWGYELEGDLVLEDEDWYIESEVEDNKKKNNILNGLENALNSHNLRLDYIKSTPAYYSFSYDYTIANKNDDKNLISYDRVEKYKRLFNDDESSKDGLLYNARVSKLFKAIFDEEEQHKLLFIPPVVTREGRCLKGVYKEKTGSSKRLFFTDYHMTPKSLSVILTYEANRRAVEDLKKKYEGIESIKYTSDSEISLYIDTLYNYSEKSSSKDYQGEKNKVAFVDTNNLVNCLYNTDKSNYKQNTDYKYGSPYWYAKERKNIFNNDDQISRFCKAYYKYMCHPYSLRVILAYCTDIENNRPENIYEAIFWYGEKACIWDIFDEYSEYIVKDKEKYKVKGEVKYKDQSFVDAFVDILTREPSDVSVQFRNKEIPRDNMATNFAYGHYAGAKNNDSSAKTLERKIRRFNSPFRPFCFISTFIGQEGFDFHVYCRKIVHWSLEYNPVKFEQREGRINRYQGYANRLKLSKFLGKENMDNCSNWEEAFAKAENENPDMKEKSKGLFPNYAIDIEDEQTALVREAYYYPGSFEAYYYENVLLAVGYYRSLLGQSGNDTFEENFKKFVKRLKLEESVNKLFINLYPPKKE